MFYTSSEDLKLGSYLDNNWRNDLDERKSTTGFIFLMGNIAFTWSSKKQATVTLSSCEAEYVAVAQLSVKESSLTIGQQLARNLVYHDRSKRIDNLIHAFIL